MVKRFFLKFSLFVGIFIGVFIVGSEVLAIKICECNLIHTPVGQEIQRDPQKVRWEEGVTQVPGKYMTSIVVPNAGEANPLSVGNCTECKTTFKDKVAGILRPRWTVEDCYNCEASAIDSPECKKIQFEWDKTSYGTQKEYLGILNGQDPWYQTSTPKTVEVVVKVSALGTPKIVCGNFGCDPQIIEIPGTCGFNCPIKIHTDKVGNLNVLLKSEIGAISTSNDCVESSTTTIYYMVNYNCSDRMKDASGNKIDCSKESKLADCKKACENNNCVWSGGVGGACISKPQDVAAGGTGSGDSGGVSVGDYGPEYFKKQYPMPKGYNGPLPECAFSGTCRDTNNLVELIIKFGQGLFAILGSLAFVFFIYGGFTIIISFGNAEKVKKGQGAMVAALVGLLISFGAYLAVDILLDVLNVGADFRGIK